MERGARPPGWSPPVPVTAGRVILIVLGSIGVLRFATPTYALTRTRLEVDTDGTGWLLNDGWFGKVRIRGESPGAKMLFIGVGAEAAVARYLGSVAHASVQDIDFDPFRVK
jgi:hypothetical protein